MQARQTQRLSLFLLLCLLATLGCQQRAPRPATDPSAAEPVVVAPEPKPAPVVQRSIPTPQPPAPDPLQLTVLVSANEPEYTEIADALVDFAGAVRIHRVDLEGRPEVARAKLKELRAESPQSVVAIGLLAALIARELDGANVVFCQVLNYAEHNLIDDHTLGISALPCLQDAVKTWKALGAELKTVGVITAEGHADNIERVTRQWEPLGVAVRHEITHSDKETIAIFQKMLPEIDGYWLLPDNRVLSREALREIMSMARRAGVGVLVHDEQLLSYGSLISARSDPAEIAEMAYDQLLAAHTMGGFTAEGVQKIYRSHVRVDAKSASLLGLSIDGIPQDRIAR